MITTTDTRTKSTPFLGTPSSLRLEAYDAVIEGTVATRRDPAWNELGFHREMLYVPRDIGALVTGERRIELYGRTHDFFSVREVPLRGHDHYPVALVDAEWPRTIVLKNGHIYVAKDLRKDAAYMAKIPDIVGMAGIFFENGNFGN